MLRMSNMMGTERDIDLMGMNQQRYSNIMMGRNMMGQDSMGHNMMGQETMGRLNDIGVFVSMLLVGMRLVCCFYVARARDGRSALRRAMTISLGVA